MKRRLVSFGVFGMIASLFVPTIQALSPTLLPLPLPVPVPASALLIYEYSRQDFVSSLLLSALPFSQQPGETDFHNGDAASIISIPQKQQQQQQTHHNSNSNSIPLKFLPVGGCWALKIALTDRQFNEFKYYAIVDTGSPFLTSPSVALERTRPTRYPSTQEQYGESTGGMLWRQAEYATLTKTVGGEMQSSALNFVVEQPKVVLGIASEQVIKETGGIFLGLIKQDDHRPTFLQQFGYKSFKIDFSKTNPSMLLSDGPMINENDPDSFPLFDLQPYGPDLHHYGVVCKRLELTWRRKSDDALLQGEKSRTESIQTFHLKRPVVVVLDTGLTGCIISDSLYEELLVVGEGSHDTTNNTIDDLQRLQISLSTLGDHTINLASNDEYWRCSSFRLPWFNNEETHPHIIALGTTFWTNTESLTIDTITKRAKIGLKQQEQKHAD